MLLFLSESSILLYSCFFAVFDIDMIWVNRTLSRCYIIIQLHNVHQLILLCLDSASKHALQSFFDSLRAEVAKHQIAVTVVSPGYIQTNLSLAAMNADGTSHGGNKFLIIAV